MSQLTVSMRLALALRRTKLAKVLESRLLGEVKDPDLVRFAMRELLDARMPPLIGASLTARTERLLKTLIKSSYVPARRPKGHAHLFGKRDLRGTDPIHRKYLSDLDELRRLVRSAEFDKLLETNAGRALAKTQAAQIFRSLDITVAERYRDLTRETYAHNSLVKRLYPTDFPGLRIDAQHVIEQRAFPKFAEDWKLLGWESPRDMPASPVMYEWHLLNPKSVEGWRLADARVAARKLQYKNPPERGALGFLDKADVDAEELNSLTDMLEKRIKISEMKTAEEMLDAYIAVYDYGWPTKTGKNVNPYQSFLETTREIKAALLKAKGKAPTKG